MIVYIDIEMPDTCEECNLESFCNKWIDARKMCGEWKPGVKATIRHPDCPLIPATNVRFVPEGGIGEMSDGYHTFNGLYYQRMILFAALIKAYKNKAWKSWKHEDGELCFGGGWFIVGIDTPEGSYTYHYEAKDWDMFTCAELPVAKHWDGHTEEDVTRLLSLDIEPVMRGKWKHGICQACFFDWSKIAPLASVPNFCPNCGAIMEES